MASPIQDGGHDVTHFTQKSAPCYHCTCSVCPAPAASSCCPLAILTILSDLCTLCTVLVLLYTIVLYIVLFSDNSSFLDLYVTATSCWWLLRPVHTYAALGCAALSCAALGCAAVCCASTSRASRNRKMFLLARRSASQRNVCVNGPLVGDYIARGRILSVFRLSTDQQILCLEALDTYVAPLLIVISRASQCYNSYI